MVEGRIVEMEAGRMVVFLEASTPAGKSDNQRRDGDHRDVVRPRNIVR